MSFLAARISSGPGVLRGIGEGLGLVVADILNTQELEDLEERFAVMTKGHRTMVREALLDQHVAIEAAHLMDGENADTAKTGGGHRQNLTLGNVGAEVALTVALQTEEGDLAGGDITLEGTAGEVGIGSFRLKEPVLDELILDSAVRAHLAARRVAAMEAHEGVGQSIVELALDLLFPHLGRYRVVDVEDGDGVLGDTGADVLGESAVDVNFATDGNTA